MVPFSIFIIVPFMELALPLALRLFPNMLPSTFQDSLKAEEGMKRELQSRIAMAQFFQEYVIFLVVRSFVWGLSFDPPCVRRLTFLTPCTPSHRTLEELAKEQKRKAAKKKIELADAGVTPEEVGELEDSAASMLEFLAKARNGEMIPPDVIVRYANYFQDDLTLDNMPRMQLINMCKYMSIPPYGSDAFLRFQLRHKIRVLKEDDQRILWEGIDSLTKMELREACQERGMRSTGLSKDAYKQSLQQWLDLSVHKNVPISLLIMSRIFFLRDEIFEPKVDEGASSSLSGLADAISGLDKEVLDQVILEVATSKEKQSDPDIRKLKLEVVSKQNELIRQEEAARKAKAKRKEVEISEEPVSEAIPTDFASSTEVTFKAAEGVHVQVPPAEMFESKPEPEGTEPRERDLSTAEMDAISQLVSDDPLLSERAELERIKAAIRTEKMEEKGTSEAQVKAAESETQDGEITAEQSLSQPPLGADKGDAIPITVTDSLYEQSFREETGASQETVGTTEEDNLPAEDDPVVARLKKRVESMVDKIEVQMSQVQVQIGDRLHFLDKDRDGVLTREEMAEVLQQVLKRNLSFDEAMEIASEMVRMDCCVSAAVDCRLDSPNSYRSPG